MSGRRRLKAAGAKAMGAMAALLVLAGLGVVGVRAYLRSADFKARVERFAVERLEQATGTQVTAQGFQLQLRPLRVEFEQLDFRRGPETVATVGRLALGIRLISIWQRAYALSEVEVDQPRIKIDLDGGAGPLPTGVVFELGMQRLDVERGEIEAGERRIPLELHWREVGASARREGAGYAGEVRFHQDGFALRGVGVAAADADVHFELTRDELRFGPARLEIPGAGVVEAQGRVRHLGEPSPMVEVTKFSLQTNLARWDGRVGSGSASASGQAGWQAGVGWARGAASVRDLEVAGIPGEGWSGSAEFAASSNHDGRASQDGRAGQDGQAGQEGGGGLRLTKVEMRGLGAEFRLQADWADWRTWSAQGDFGGVPLERLRRWLGAGDGGSAPLLGARASGEFGLRGTNLADARLTLAMTLTPAAAPLPLAGRVKASLAEGVWTVEEAHLESGAAALDATGTISKRRVGLRVNARTTALAGLMEELAGVGFKPPWGGGALGGEGGFEGTVSGPTDTPTFAGSVRLAQVRLARPGGASFAADLITASGVLSPRQLQLSRAVAEAGAQRFTATGEVGLSDYGLTPASALRVEASLEGVSVGGLASLANLHYGVRGRLAGQATVGGSWGDPTASGSFRMTAVQVRDQVIPSITAGFSIAQHRLASSNVAVALAHTRIGGKLNLDFARRTYSLALASPAVELADLAPLQSPRLAVRGEVRFELTGGGSWDRPEGALVLTTTNLRGGGESLGDVAARAQLAGGQLTFQAADILADGSFNLSGGVGTAAPYPVRAEVRLRDYDFDAWLRRFTPAELSGHSLVSGSASVNGPLAEPDRLAVRIALDPVELAISGLVLRNQGPVRISAADRRAVMAPTHLVGQETDFVAQGSATAGSSLAAPWALAGMLAGRINLKLIESLHPTTHASGELEVAATLGGTTADPALAGTLAVENGSLAEDELPIAFDGIEGNLVLRGNRAQIERLTAHTGSGTLSLSGFAARSAGLTSFDLNAQGQNLRLRYQGISTTGDVQLRLNGSSGPTPSGNAASALLSGTAQLNRIGLDENFDLALFIAAMQATPAPPDPTSILNRVRMDIRLTTGPQVEVATNLAHLQVQADLRLRGTLANPVVLGRANTSEGRLLFGGNEYQVTRAQVQFDNPFRIEPLLDISLSTTVQQYDVTLNLTGPADKLAINYRSDPPLSSSDVVALLATGAPTQATATLSGAGAATVADSSAQLLGQALNNVVSGRLQRLFGVTQIQVNPYSGPLGTTGSGGTVTIQQQVSRNVKLTYTQNLATSSQDVIQVDWTINRSLAVMMNRDQFGLYGVQFIFRQRAR